MTAPSPSALIRPARLDDLPAILDMLAVDSLRESPEDLRPPVPRPYLDAFAEISRDPNNQLLVAELDGRVVGTFQLTYVRHLMYRGALIAQIEAVRVETGLRSQGLGAQMMRWAIDQARQRGCARIQLTTNKARKDAHRFYARLGFVPSHEGMKLYLGPDPSER